MSELLGVYFGMFDVDTGPALRAQFPLETLTNEAFETVSSYIITKPEIGGRPVKYLLGNKRLVGHFMVLPGTHFRRNEFMFNLFFAVQANADTLPYERVVKKLNVSLATLEQESSFLSCAEARAALPELVKAVYSRLTESGECILPINDANTICLKLSRSITAPPPPIVDFEVPIFLQHVGDTRTWDLALQRILPHIDGVNHIQRIAQLSNVDPVLVREGLRYLQHNRLVTVVDIFQFANMYTLTGKFRASFLRSVERMQQCAKFVSIGKVVPVGACIRLLAGMKHGVTVNDISVKSKQMGIDERRLVLWALRRGVLRRVHCYPVALDQLATPLIPLPPVHTMPVPYQAAPTLPPGPSPSPHPSSTTPTPQSQPDYVDVPQTSSDTRKLTPLGALPTISAATTPTNALSQPTSDSITPMSTLTDSVVPPRNTRPLDGSHCLDEILSLYGSSDFQLPEGVKLLYR